MTFRGAAASSVFVLILFAFLYIGILSLTDEKTNTPKTLAEDQLKNMNSTTNKTPEKSMVRLQVNPKHDVWMRQCAGVSCQPIAMLRKGGFVNFYQTSKIIETSKGSLDEWLEVKLAEGEYCLPSMLSLKWECSNWTTSPAISGWMNKSQLRPSMN